MADAHLMIGMEIHVQLATKSKLFCGCSNDSFGKTANTLICPICMGHPGTLPVPNRQVVKLAILAGLAFDGEIPSEMKFDRKNYFYPDLPKGYQITQFDQPVVEGGNVKIIDEGEQKVIELERIHIEEDAGKLTHPVGADYSLVDYNRAGTPLIEIVTKPQIKSAKEAVLLGKDIQRVVRFANISMADMEKGHMRFDCNINLVDGDGNKLTEIVEVKNLNSFRSLERAIQFEYDRHLASLSGDEKIVRETRGWNDDLEITESQRDKEEAHDYRYFPEPDIPTIMISSDFVEDVRRELPEMPSDKRKRFVEEYGITDESSRILSEDKVISEFFEESVSEVVEWFLENNEDDPKQKRKLITLLSNWLLVDLFGLMKAEKVGISDIKITPENFAELCMLVFDASVTKSAGQRILKEMFETGNDPTHIMNEKGLKQVDNIDELGLVCDQIIQNHPDIVTQIKAGKESAIQFLVGQVMRETKGAANPQKTIEILKKKIS